jgi:hypothetical protein
MRNNHQGYILLYFVNLTLVLKENLLQMVLEVVVYLRFELFIFLYAKC